MPGPYSKDVRHRIVAAVLEQDERPARVAKRFAVGRSTVYRWVHAARHEGRLAAKPMLGGPKPVIRGDVAVSLAHLVASDNHLTLAEYRDKLAAATGVRVHPWTIGRALQRMGQTRKKEDAARRRARPH